MGEIVVHVKQRSFQECSVWDRYPLNGPFIPDVDIRPDEHAHCFLNSCKLMSNRK